mmetsp:Transcript_18371/g.48715  ORF Transcript_18371/g.48715 Transcript_18371/m.48715 type:complete len:90 (+) Transcript_18371:352-621(+)
MLGHGLKTAFAWAPETMSTSLFNGVGTVTGKLNLLTSLLSRSLPPPLARACPFLTLVNAVPPGGLRWRRNVLGEKTGGCAERALSNGGA